MKKIEIVIDETGKVSIDQHDTKACEVAREMGKALALDTQKEKKFTAKVSQKQQQSV